MKEQEKKHLLCLIENLPNLDEKFYEVLEDFVYRIYKIEDEIEEIKKGLRNEFR